MSFLILLTTALSAWAVNLDSIPNYYGAQFKTDYSSNRIQDDELKNNLFQILSSGHIKNENAPDQIVASCDSYYTPSVKVPNQDETPVIPPTMNSVTNNFSLTDIVPNPPTESENPKFPPDELEPVAQPAKCVQHRSLGYEGARRKLFGWMHLKQKPNGEYYVRDAYCERDFTDADFNGEKTFGPGLLPKSGNIINTEHTWPQSRFTGRFPREQQKSDLHHLFPTDSEMNSRRGSLRFGYVQEEVEKMKCAQNKLGHQTAGGIIFEVPDSQKGNTARAIFYFATRYQMKISPPEEEALRRWHVLDPIDDEERTRNNQIEEVQGNRNPFIDIPDLLNKINHF